ncbi:ferredoxin [Clostridia bacterium]|nr:ferredoxin [Clostridia bacterium]
MIYNSAESEKKAVLQAAELMVAAARTAPKACGTDVIEAAILDGADKDKLTAAMRECKAGLNPKYFARDAALVDRCPCIVLIGGAVVPRGLNCGLCGVKTCAAAAKGGVACAMAVDDVGIAVGSAASVAMDCRIDNRILFTAGMAALHLGCFSDKVKICFGIGLSATGKNIFFDRPAI